VFGRAVVNAILVEVQGDVVDQLSAHWTGEGFMFAFEGGGEGEDLVVGSASVDVGHVDAR
jgi:hypothetical protein